MVTLYQDPEGVTVFRGEATAAATARASSDQTTIETLRRRIRELETILSDNVSNVSYTNIHNKHLLVSVGELLSVVTVY